MWLKRTWFLPVACLLVACASSPFETSWKAAGAAPLQIDGAKVAALAMMESESERRAAEDAIVRALDDRGAAGVAMYTIVPGAAPGSEAEVRTVLEGLGFSGAVVVRPIARKTEIVAEPVFVGPSHLVLWNGYYAFGWNEPWRVVAVDDVRTLVSVEVLVYSLRQNKLVWGGQTTTTDTGSVTRLVDTTARRVAKELERQGLLAAAQASLR